MLVQRLSRVSDLAEIQRLAASSPAGVSALPDDADRLVEILELSEASMTGGISFSGEERYFFVIEDVLSGRLVGCSSVIACAGFSEPFYTFRNEMFVHASRQLGLHNRMHVLSLCHDLTGHSLLCGFYLESEYQHAEAVALNARGRLLFMASHPQRFAESTSVELVGVSDGEGNAPFWDAVGRHFFAVSYSEAEKIGNSRGRSSLAELMPGYPIYVPMLSDAAQEVIGQVHASAQAVFELLMEDGFETDNYVDIFDGGPVVHGRTRELHTVRSSLIATVEIGSMQEGGVNWLVANQCMSDFRACVLSLTFTPGEALMLNQATADLLCVAAGDTLRLTREA
jgi:arginine N-succinyltransferase